MCVTLNERSGSSQRSGVYRNLLVALAICGSWFVLAPVSTLPALFLNIDARSGLAQGIAHGIRLLGGLLIVLGLVPLLLRAYYPNYRSYLRAIGILPPRERHHNLVLIAFGLVVIIFLIADIAKDGLGNLKAYHIANGIPTLELAVFTSFQAAVVEELIFRGGAFGILRRRFPVWVAILLPAILFGFAHIWWGMGRVATTALIGGLFALLRWRTDNLWGPIVMHFLIGFGIPIPAWLGWLVAMVLTAGLQAVNSTHSHNAPGDRSQ